MKKVLLISCFLILSFYLSAPVNAETTLREPQGRLGTYFKPEKYVPANTINLSQQTFEHNNKSYKNEQKMPKKPNKEITKPQKTSNRAVKKEDLSQKDLQRQFLAEKKKANELKKQENKEIQAVLQKENKEKIAIQQKENKERLAQQKLEEKRLKAEEKTILTHSKEPQEPKEAKLSFKLGKKEKTEETPVVTESKKTAVKNTEPAEDKTFTANIVQDSDTRNIVTEIKTELTNDRQKMLEELSTLWVSAVQKSDTVYFAIMKLSNPNGEEVNKNGFKKILEPIIGAAPLVGQAFVNPALTAGSIIGSNVLGTAINDSAKHRLTKVNDADLVILARAIDELQETLLMNYMAYKGAKEEYELAIKIAQERQKEYEELNKKNSPNTLLANTFYTEALDYQYKTRQDFLMKRVVLEQMVGSDALTEIETGIKKEPVEEPEQIEEPQPKSKKHFFKSKTKKS